MRRWRQCTAPLRRLLSGAIVGFTGRASFYQRSLVLEPGPGRYWMAGFLRSLAVFWLHNRVAVPDTGSASRARVTQPGCDIPAPMWRRPLRLGRVVRARMAHGPSQESTPRKRGHVGTGTGPSYRAKEVASGRKPPVYPCRPNAKRYAFRSPVPKTGTACLPVARRVQPRNPPRAVSTSYVGRHPGPSCFADATATMPNPGHVGTS